MKSAQPLYALMDTSNDNTIFTPFQMARNFNKTIYSSCPWFLEYVEGKFPSNEELQHNNVVKEREDPVTRGQSGDAEAAQDTGRETGGNTSIAYLPQTVYLSDLRRDACEASTVAGPAETGLVSKWRMRDRVCIAPLYSSVPLICFPSFLPLQVRYAVPDIDLWLTMFVSY